MNQNELKKIASLDQGKYRKKHGLFSVEGTHGVAELLKSGWRVERLIATNEAAQSAEIMPLLEIASGKGIPLDTIKAREFARLVSTETPQGILAVARLPRNNPGQLTTLGRVVVADGVSDPGNLGTMARTALAFGFEGLATTPGSADLFNPKTIRGSQGALFHLSLAGHIEAADLVEVLKPSFKILALTADANTELAAVKPSGKVALVVGAEIAGVGEMFLKAADYQVRIPMAGRVESLNAAVAAAIAMYELSRARA